MLGSPVVLTSTGTCIPAPALPVSGAAYTVNASYPGTPAFSSSASSGVGNGSLTVQAALTTTTLASHTPDPVTVLSPITVSVSVAVNAPGVGTPTGTITVSDGSASCSIVLPATNCSLVPTSSGAKSLMATYAGDSNFAGSVSAGVTQTVSPLVSFNGATPAAGVSGTVTLSGGGPQCSLVNPQFIVVAPLVPPQGVSFPYGLFDFTTTSCTPGSTISIQIVYSQPLPPNTLYWKFGPTPGNPNPHWYVMPGSSATATTVNFSITDGQVGDDDLLANGTIVDQGGPGVLPPGVPPLPIPALSPMLQSFMALLIALSALLALHRMRRKP